MRIFDLKIPAQEIAAKRLRNLAQEISDDGAEMATSDASPFANTSPDQIGRLYLDFVQKNRERAIVLCKSMPRDFIIEISGKKYKCNTKPNEQTTTHELANMLVDIGRFSPILWAKFVGFAVLGWEFVKYEA